MDDLKHINYAFLDITFGLVCNITCKTNKEWLKKKCVETKATWVLKTRPEISHKHFFPIVSWILWIFVLVLVIFLYNPLLPSTIMTKGILNWNKLLIAFESGTFTSNHGNDVKKISQTNQTVHWQLWNARVVVLIDHEKKKKSPETKTRPNTNALNNKKHKTETFKKWCWVLHHQLCM